MPCTQSMSLLALKMMMVLKFQFRNSSSGRRSPTLSPEAMRLHMKEFWEVALSARKSASTARLVVLRRILLIEAAGSSSYLAFGMLPFRYNANTLLNLCHLINTAKHGQRKVCLENSKSRLNLADIPLHVDSYGSNFLCLQTLHHLGLREVKAASL